VKYYARSLQNAGTDRWQGLADHLKGVATLAQACAEKFGAGSWGEAGLLHDVGKYSKAFQARLAGDPSQVDQSTAGARRPELEKAIQALGPSDVLILAEWDRATRSMLDGIRIIEQVAARSASLKALGSAMARSDHAPGQRHPCVLVGPG